MSSRGERYTAIAAQVVKGELTEQDALATFLAISADGLDEVTALGVLELHLKMASAVHRAEGQSPAYSYSVRELFKKELALDVYEGRKTLDGAASELTMTVPQASVVLGAHHSFIYGLPMRQHMHELAEAPVDDVMRTTRRVQEQRARSAQPDISSGPPAGHLRNSPPGQPSAIPHPYQDPPTGPVQIPGP